MIRLKDKYKQKATDILLSSERFYFLISNLCSLRNNGRFFFYCYNAVGVRTSFSLIFKISIYSDARSDIVDLIPKVRSPYETSHSHRVSRVLNQQCMLERVKIAVNTVLRMIYYFVYIHDRSNSKRYSVEPLLESYLCW